MASGSPDCLIHFEGESGPLAVFMEVAYKKFLECREIWKTLDGKQREIAEKTACWRKRMEEFSLPQSVLFQVYEQNFNKKSHNQV